MEILDLFDELEEMGAEGERWYCKVFPFLWGKTAIDAAQFYEIIHELRSSLPDELTTANKIARDRDKIVQEAHEERAKILEAAREQAQLLVSNDELVKQAQARAQEIVNQAQVDADAMRSDAESWARNLIDRLENYLARTQSTIEKAREQLEHSSPRERPDVGPPPQDNE